MRSPASISRFTIASPDHPTPRSMRQRWRPHTAYWSTISLRNRWYWMLNLQHPWRAVADGGDKNAGVAVGEAAAMAVISARANDGLEANVTYVPGSGPGAWIPTPPSFASSSDAMAGPDAALYDESGRRFPARRPPGFDQRRLETGLQPDSHIRRHGQYHSFRGRNAKSEPIGPTIRDSSMPGHSTFWLTTIVSA